VTLSVYMGNVLIFDGAPGRGDVLRGKPCSRMRSRRSRVALEVYARKMERKRDTGQRMDALIRGADWTRAGTNDECESEAVAASENEKAAFAAAL